MGTEKELLTKEERAAAIAEIDKELEEMDELGEYLDKRYMTTTYKGNSKPEQEIEGFAPFAPFALPDTSQLPSFPVENIPPIAWEYIEEVAESIQVSVDMVAVVVLGVVSICVQGIFYIEPKPDWEEPLNVFILSIARPSERKTPVMKEVTRPIYDYVAEVNFQRQPLIDEYDIKKDVLTKKVNTLKEAAAKEKKSMQDVLDAKKELTELEEVVPLRLMVDDITPEALVKVLRENEERSSIVTAEGGIFGMMAGRYSNQPNMDIFLKAYSGEPYSSDRIGRKGESLNNPLLTMLIMAQYVVITDAMQNKEFRERGLLARFLYSLPASRIGGRTYKSNPIRSFVRKRYDDLIKELLEIREWKFQERQVIRLSEDADKESEAFANEIEKKLLDEFEEIEDWAGKLHGQTMRIAGILHCMKYKISAAEVELAGDTMKEAVAIGKYFVEHAMVAFKMAGLADPQEVKDAKYILKRMDSAKGAKGAKVKKRDFWNTCQGHFPTVAEMEPGLDELVKNGYIRIEKVKTGGRPTEYIELNPEYLQYMEQEGKEK